MRICDADRASKPTFLLLCRCRLPSGHVDLMRECLRDIPRSGRQNEKLFQLFCLEASIDRFHLRVITSLSPQGSRQPYDGCLDTRYKETLVPINNVLYVYMVSRPVTTFYAIPALRVYKASKLPIHLRDWRQSNAGIDLRMMMLMLLRHLHSLPIPR